MSDFDSGNLRPANPPASRSRFLLNRCPVNLVLVGAFAALLVFPVSLGAHDFDRTPGSTPMGQLPQIAIGQEYQLAPDPDNPDNPPQFQPVPNSDSDDSSMNSDDDNNSDDNADNGDNDQNQNDDNSDNGNSQDNTSSDDNSPPPSSN